MSGLSQRGSPTGGSRKRGRVLTDVRGRYRKAGEFGVVLGRDCHACTPPNSYQNCEEWTRLPGLGWTRPRHQQVSRLRRDDVHWLCRTTRTRQTTRRTCVHDVGRSPSTRSPKGPPNHAEGLSTSSAPKARPPSRIRSRHRRGAPHDHDHLSRRPIVPTTATRASAIQTAARQPLTPPASPPLASA